MSACGMANDTDWAHYKCPDYPGATGYDNKLDGSMALSVVSYDLFQGSLPEGASIPLSRYLAATVTTLPSKYGNNTESESQWFDFFDNFGDSHLTRVVSGGLIQLLLDPNVGMHGSKKFGGLDMITQVQGMFEYKTGINGTTGQPTNTHTKLSPYMFEDFGWVFLWQLHCSGGDPDLCREPFTARALR